LGEIIVVTSLKGGVGKTLFSASLACSMAQEKKRVLAVDMDLGTGGLDIALGREHMVLPTFLDLLSRLDAHDDLLVPGENGITFLSAPVFFEEKSLDHLSQTDFDRVLSRLKKAFDVLIFDMPAGGGAAFRFLEASSLVNLICLVTTASPTSIRAAERCAMRIDRPERIKLILNSFRISSPKDNSFGVLEVIEKTSVPILGVIPFDKGAEKALVSGVPLAASKKSAAGKAIRNISSRILGESVPMFDGVMRRRRRNRFY